MGLEMEAWCCGDEAETDEEEVGLRDGIKREASKSLSSSPII